MKPRSVRDGILKALTWERLLLLLLVAMMATFSLMAPNFLKYFNIMNSMFSFMEKGIIALTVTLVIICGEIDVSLSSMIALSSLVMGLASRAGAGTALIILLGLFVGAAAGFFNGLLISRLEIPAIAVTLGTMSFYRGISYAVLGDQGVKNYPESFLALGNGFIGSTNIPIPLVVFAVLAAAIALLLHKTRFGRYAYIVGNSKKVAAYSGINVANVKLAVFTLTGLFCGIASVLLTSRIGSTRPNIANQWDIEIITAVVLGGVAITGGKGRLDGVLISVFLLGFLKYGLGILNVQGKVAIIFTGFLLIVAVLLPDLMRQVNERLEYGSRGKRS
jgi:rhamnose transport system permease protein